jgi:hypothetical protein
MKKLATLFLLIILTFCYIACNEDENKDYNTLKISSGEFKGYSHEFSPNLGFWSPVNESVRMVDLILGDDQMNLTEYEDKMAILFYYDGTPQVQFPSPEGQSIVMGLNIEGSIYYFNVLNAVLVIYRLDDLFFEGAISGEFVDQSDGTNVIDINMEIRMDLQEI